MNDGDDDTKAFVASVTYDGMCTVWEYDSIVHYGQDGHFDWTGLEFQNQ
jgi:hypothetical protein